MTLEGDYSVAFDEAENRLTAQMAILVYFSHKFSVDPTIEKMHEDKLNSFLDKLWR